MKSGTSTDTAKGGDAPLWPEVERQIGLCQRDGLSGNALALLNRCSIIIKGLEARLSETAATKQVPSGFEGAYDHSKAFPAQPCVVVPLHPHVDGQDFYELCQQYRHSREMMPNGLFNTVQAFNNLREYIKTGKLPWPSYERECERSRP